MQRARLPSFEDHLEYANPPIRPVLVYLRGRIKALGRMGEKVTPTVNRCRIQGREKSESRHELSLCRHSRAQSRYGLRCTKIPLIIASC
jgi:ribosomal protein S14